MADHIAVAETEIDASPEDVWDALTDPKQIEALMKAPTEPEADHRANAIPTISAMPAPPRFEVIESIGPEKVCAADSGPILVTISVSLLLVVAGSPTRPKIATKAISAGNNDSSP